MVLLWGAVIGIAIGLIRGGKIANLEKMGIRYLWLVPVSLLIQLAIFPIFSEEPFLAFGTEILHVASYLVLFVFVALNRGVWQIPFMGIGMGLNLLVIGMNGGYMPSSVVSLIRAGEFEVAYYLTNQGTYGNVTEMKGSTVLDFFGDWLYLPSWFPLSTAFSIGDLLVATGLVFFFGTGMVAGEAES